MKKILFLFIVCAFFVPDVTAQVALKIEMPQYTFLQYEPVYVKISMRNMSGHPLAFGENSGLHGQLRFEIYSMEKNGFARLKTNETPTMTGIILQPSVTRVFTYNVSSFYDVRKIGHYTLKAVISHPQMDSAYESNTTHFSVTTGHDIWKTIVGVPQTVTDNINPKIHTRCYRISSYNNGVDSFYVLFIEDDKKIYFVTRLGVDMGYQLRPQCAVDDQNRLHLLVAASPKVFAYYQYDITGHLDEKEVRIKTDTTPRLVTNKDVGTVILSGGRKARPDMDYEEIKSLPYISKALEETKTSLTSGKKLLDDKED